MAIYELDQSGNLLIRKHPMKQLHFTTCTLNPKERCNYYCPHFKEVAFAIGGKIKLNLCHSEHIVDSDNFNFKVKS